MTDSGRPFIGIGENLAWGVPGRIIATYEDAFARFEANGMNLVRIWSVRWNLALEWTTGRGAVGQVAGLGRYALDNAWRLDRVLASARAHGVRVILTLETYSNVSDTEGGTFANLRNWPDNPYNAVNGGPCAADDPADFFRDPRARRLFRNRLDYVVARWGADTALFAIEYFNETRVPAEWLDEMSAHVRALDPYGHLLTCSEGYPWGNDRAGFERDSRRFRAAAGTDFVSEHYYTGIGDDHTAGVVARLGGVRGELGKPFQIAEVGYDSRFSDRTADPTGRGTVVRNAGWAALMSGSFSNALNWWWDDYVEPLGLYRVFRPMAGFAARVDWLAGEFSPLRATIPEITDPAELARLPGDLVVTPTGGWGQTDGAWLRVRPDGRVDGGRINQFLHGTGKPDLRLVPEITVDFPGPGRAVVTVDEVSIDAVLQVAVDGVLAVSRELPAAPGSQTAAGFRRTELQPRWGSWRATYDLDVVVPVPAGRHTIRLENTGSDWLSLKRLTFTGCRDRRTQRLGVVGQQRRRDAIAWLHDLEDTMRATQAGEELPGFASARFAIDGLEDGPYQVEWWDTGAGGVLAVGTATAAAGRLPLAAPAFHGSIAVRVSR